MNTSYGAFASAPGEDFESQEPKLPRVGEAAQSSSMLGRCIKPTALAAGLLLISFAAVSLSGQAGFSFTPMNAAVDATSNGESVSRPVYATLADYEKEALFRNYVETYNKQYKTDEYTTKLTIFKDFLSLCDARNMAEAAAGGSAVHGVTKFADLSPSEYEEYLGYSETTASLEPDHPTIAAYTGTATVVDWTDKYTTGIKDQGYCGSCWAFSAVSQIESDAIRAGVLTTSDTLSTQQIVSCDAIDAGCQGGDTEQAYQYIKENGGVSTESTYPYTSYYGVVDTCDSSLASSVKVSITDFATLRDDSLTATEIEENMKSYVMSTGPLSVCLDASTWSTYVSGVVSMCGTTVDHCVQVVGIDTEEGSWKIRNQWGSDWGEDGYIRIAYGADTCSITYDPTFSYIESDEVEEEDTEEVTVDEDEDADEDEDEDEPENDNVGETDDAAEPPATDDAAEPTTTDDAAEPPATDDAAEPPATDDAAEPTTTDDAAEPPATDDAAEPTTEEEEEDEDEEDEEEEDEDEEDEDEEESLQDALKSAFTKRAASKSKTTDSSSTKKTDKKNKKSDKKSSKKSNKKSNKKSHSKNN